MWIISPVEKRVELALCQFIFPFSIQSGLRTKLTQMLSQEGFIPFSLKNLELEAAFYGEKHKVSHRELERFFLPYTENLLFPQENEDEGFQRYSKKIAAEASLHSRHGQYRFKLHSIDVIICPFDLCFVTIRTEITEPDLTYSQALDFADHFRAMEELAADADHSVIHTDKVDYREIKDYLFEELISFIVPFLDRQQEEAAYFETLPFFIDERMFTLSLFAFAPETEISQTELFRAGHLTGFDLEGKPCVAATNPVYEENYYQEHVYDRWAPNTFFVYDMQTFSCLTVGGDRNTLANQMYGNYYYGLLLFLFQKIVLYKLSYFYSKLDFNKDSEEMEMLIRSITLFSSRYFFPQVIAQTQGREIFDRVSLQFGNRELYKDVKETLTTLFQNREKFRSRRNNYLLMILTIYTVITGIFGMNLVIGDFETDAAWYKLAEYTSMEYLVLFIMLSGIVIGFLLGIGAMVKWLRDWMKERRKGQPTL